ncbi:DHA2 family efflux MFS transporter permease subunit [Microvirga massiliensis]|uniref:DHA2 family efflux MFS transporter permease subunit n=1 Tax=Microvirga massiliensis TaxID=1033741 RepID=UPI00062BE3A3|nr:DHA2 family efflux MFS transporter permease subunit [Microvirga massiliensis]
MSSAVAAEERVPVATWIGFSAMGLGMFMAILDIQVVATSLPTIREALGIAPEQMSWVQTAYLIAEVIAIPLTGWLTRMLTMRGLFTAAVAIFTAASIGCASSMGFAELTAWRVVQGFAGGTLIPLVFTAVFVIFPKRVEPVATTIAGVLAVLAPTLGPVVGGWITQTWSWHWLFLINVIPGIFACLAGWLHLPRERPDFALATSVDLLALLAIALSLAALEIGLKEAPKRGWSSPVSLALFALCIAGCILFVRRSLQAPFPVVNLRTLRDRRLAIGCVLSFLTGVGLYGSIYLMPVFLAFVRDHGPLRIGEIMLVTGIAQLVAAPLVIQAERRVDAATLTVIGFVAFGIGLGLSAFETRETDFDEMFWPQAIRGIAIMLCLLPPTRVALGHLPPDRVPDASSLFNLMRNLGGAIGIAWIDTIIWTRAPVHAGRVLDRLRMGDLEAARGIGIPDMYLSGPLPSLDSPLVQAFLKPLLEKAGLVAAINEAWAMIAAIVLVGAPLLILSGVGRNVGVAAASKT